MFEKKYSFLWKFWPWTKLHIDDNYSYKKSIKQQNSDKNYQEYEQCKNVKKFLNVVHRKREKERKN